MFRILRIAAILTFVLMLSGPLPQVSAGSNKLDIFAKCISAKKAKMYGLFWCPHCAEQKELFGSAFQYVNYVECGVPGTHNETDECKNFGVKHFPTWEFANHSRQEKVLQMQELSQQTGCPVP